MHLKPVAAVLCAGLLWAGSAQAADIDITFEGLAAGTVLSNQYATLGVTFDANAFTGPGTSTSGRPWATNTNMTITALSGQDVGGVGMPNLVSGNILRTFSGWSAENGDASFAAIFSTPITSFSADFAGVGIAQDVRLFVYAGSTLLSTVVGTETTSQFTLSYTGEGVTRVVIAPGSYEDWVGVDNIRFTQAVPEPESFAMLALGLGVLGIARRRLKAAAQA